MPKKSPKKNSVTVEYRIDAKYAPVVFCPSNAIEDTFWRREENVDPLFRTADGKVCKPRFLGTTNNRCGDYEEEFDYICERRFNMPFSAVRSIWFARLGWLDDYWHLIELKEE